MNKSTGIAFIDFQMTLISVFLIFVGLLILNVYQSKGNVTDKAEFVAILEWNESSSSDVDLWVQDPNKNILYFRHQDVGLMTLDRDDTGINDNVILSSDGKTVASPVRREQASIRGIIPGQFVVNVMMYAFRDATPVTAHVQIIKLNPFSVVVDREVVLDQKGQEQTIASFTVGSDGQYSNVDTNTQYQLSRGILQ